MLENAVINNDSAATTRAFSKPDMPIILAIFARKQTINSQIIVEIVRLSQNPTVA